MIECPWCGNVTNQNWVYSAVEAEVRCEKCLNLFYTKKEVKYNTYKNRSQT